MNHRGQRALRDGDWKYLRVDENDYLFNIPADERERANRAPREPQRLAAMREAWEEWNRDDASNSRGRHGERGLFGQGHATTLTSSPPKRLRAMDGDSRRGSAPKEFLPTEVQQTFLEPLSAAAGAAGPHLCKHKFPRIPRYSPGIRSIGLIRLGR